MSAQVATNDPEKPQNNRENENGRGNSGLSRSKTKPKIEKSGQRDKSEQKTTEGNKSKKTSSDNKDTKEQSSHKFKKELKEQQNCAESSVTKQTCEACEEEHAELQFCIHCAGSVCNKCRSKHVEAQVQDFVKNREEATANQRLVNKLLQKLTNQSEDLERSESRTIEAIEAEFKQIEKALLLQKNKLKREVIRKFNSQSKPLQQQKRILERDYATIQTKYSNILRNVGLPPSSAPLSAYGKIKNNEFAQICGNTVKVAELSSAFDELKGKVHETTDEIACLEYSSEETLNDLLEKVKIHGEVKFEAKEDDENDCQKCEESAEIEKEVTENNYKDDEDENKESSAYEAS